MFTLPLLDSHLTRHLHLPRGAHAPPEDAGGTNQHQPWRGGTTPQAPAVSDRQQVGRQGTPAWPRLSRQPFEGSATNAEKGADKVVGFLSAFHLRGGLLMSFGSWLGGVSIGTMPSVPPAAPEATWFTTWM